RRWGSGVARRIMAAWLALPGSVYRMPFGIAVRAAGCYYAVAYAKLLWRLWTLVSPASPAFRSWTRLSQQPGPFHFCDHGYAVPRPGALVALCGLLKD